MASFPPLNDTTLSHSHEEILDHLFPASYPDLSLSPALVSSAPMPVATTGLPYAPLTQMSYLPQTMDMLPPCSAEPNQAMWGTSGLFDVPPNFTSQLWLPVPTTTHGLSSSIPATTYDMCPPAMTVATDSRRTERAVSFASSNASSHQTAVSSPEPSPREFSRGSSPGQVDLKTYGYMNAEGTWSCAYPGCTSRAVFTRGCDLRKHHKRHTKSFFCHYLGCSQASGGGFSSKKDLARHEAKHNPGVVCEWSGCDRVFSRVDNMVSSTNPIFSTQND
jgi:hypothetical protein